MPSKSAWSLRIVRATPGISAPPFSRQSLVLGHGRDQAPRLGHWTFFGNFGPCPLRETHTALVSIKIGENVCRCSNFPGMKLVIALSGLPECNVLCCC